MFHIFGTIEWGCLVTDGMGFIGTCGRDPSVDD